MKASRRQYDGGIRPNKNYLGGEDAILDKLDRKREILEFYEEIWPLVKKAAKFGSVDEMLKKYSPMAVMTLANQMVNGKSEGVKQQAALALMHMAEGKPVTRSLSLSKNLDTLPEAEVDAMIRGLLKKGRKPKALKPDAKEAVEAILVEALPVPEGTK